MNTYETYIVNQLKEVETKLSDLEKNKIEYSERDYEIMFNRHNAERNILYKILTAHDNKYMKGQSGSKISVRK